MQDPERVQQSVERIERLARTASSLVEDIVDLGRADAGILELLLRTEPASKVVADAVEAAGPQAAIRRVTIAADLAQVADAAVSCDARRVQQILSNLLGNALRVSEGGSSFRRGHRGRLPGSRSKTTVPDRRPRSRAVADDR